MIGLSPWLALGVLVLLTLWQWQRAGQHRTDLALRDQQIDQLQQHTLELQTQFGDCSRQLAATQAELASARTELSKEREVSAEKLALLADAKATLGNEFKLLAGQIFDARQTQLDSKSAQTLKTVLTPMQEEMARFRQRVDAVHAEEQKARGALDQHLTELRQLNHRMSEDTLNLTRALKGDSKAQGDWGEQILQRLLESSGLRQGEEYLRQPSFSDGETRQRPDVIINMPDNKHLVIDAKVSLTAYKLAMECDGEARSAAIRDHCTSMQRHIQELATKRYDQIDGIHSPDYVLMFVPIEGAYLIAIEANHAIFETAFDQHVAVVTPSTLYATLRLVEQLWRYERQSDNVAKLIDRSSRLHDKMVDFIKAFEEVGSRLQQATGAFDTAHNRMVSGRGNVLQQVHQLGQLAGRSKKELPQHLVERAEMTPLEDVSTT
ncbi:MAG: DNA recombination protein RmuC [Mariprofundales bacterium]|nr:DNA recombination protein RmuC [Mariprofundales bacterium]